MKSPRRHMVTLRYPASEKRDVPERFLRLARDRTEHLHRHCATEPIRDLLASAYLQGIEDCVETHIRRPEIAAYGPAVPPPPVDPALIIGG